MLRAYHGHPPIDTRARFGFDARFGKPNGFVMALCGHPHKGAYLLPGVVLVLSPGACNYNAGACAGAALRKLLS
jgi:hypothetical protein